VRRRIRGRLMAFEILDGPFVFLGGGAGGEGSEISAFAGLGIFFAGVESEFVAWDFANHDCLWAKEIIARLPLPFAPHVQNWKLDVEREMISFHTSMSIPGGWGQSSYLW